MTFRITNGESIEEAVRRIACEQIDQAASEISNDDLDLHETVHAFRKRCKKIRGLLPLVRPGLEPYTEENSWFRDRARQVSDVRDATAMQECFDPLIGRCAGSFGERPFADVRE